MRSDLPQITLSIRQPWCWAIPLRLSSCLSPHECTLGHGTIVATAEITGCVNRSASPWFFGTWGFVIANVQPVDFIPCRGALGFFGWADRVEERLL